MVCNSRGPTGFWISFALMVASAACANGTTTSDAVGDFDSAPGTSSQDDAGQSDAPFDNGYGYGNQGSGTGAGSSDASAASACTGGKSSCGGACVDTTNDPNNCGQCGNACGAASNCVSGSCASTEVTCTGSKTSCGGSCVDTNSDPNNCGACGNACNHGTCSGGQCSGGGGGGLSCTCSHSVCASGASLTKSCDPNQCVSAVCTIDPYCCKSTKTWDSQCVLEAQAYCGVNCSAGSADDGC